jgi:divalent metal cation (Fe/Co/Zn/Cd) transporter
MKKGIIGLLLAGGIIGIIITIIIAIIAWWFTNTYCILCDLVGPLLDNFYPGLAWWIQFFIVFLLLVYIKGKIM